MPLGVRIFLVYFLFVGLTGYFVLSTVMDEIRPGVRQSTEETLVDTANLLAEILRDDVKNGTLRQSRCPNCCRPTARAAAGGHLGRAQERGQPPHLRHRRQGIVLLDSSGAGAGPGLLALERST
jgi:two-component system sensor histidine kinase CreC